ncbi:unnamed protein product [Paramecium sonneborni]|uniref:Transmembrane protein n=1 Tax=Paramecium sonneborni TaxID=65129 RepID=A0A8S1RSY8_9CILI|nr:unnamed protein product [Paramecium sonneborni]
MIDYIENTFKIYKMIMNGQINIIKRLAMDHIMKKVKRMVYGIFWLLIFVINDKSYIQVNMIMAKKQEIGFKRRDKIMNFELMNNIKRKLIYPNYSDKIIEKNTFFQIQQQKEYFFEKKPLLKRSLQITILIQGLKIMILQLFLVQLQSNHYEQELFLIRFPFNCSFISY